MPAGDALIGPVRVPELSVMTFNIQRASVRSAQWMRRRASVGELLRRERPTLLGLQEAGPGQVRFVRSVLGSSYRSVGVGRDRRGRGEGCPVLFDAERLEAEAWDQRALSPTPDRPGSREWGALSPRVLVRLRLRDRATGMVFTVLNTHLDVLSARARSRGAELIVSAADADPVIVTGDFNEGPRGAARRILTSAGLVDAWSLSDTRLTRDRGTYAPRSRFAAARPRIDAVLCRGWHVARVAIHARPTPSGWPSDHAAVTAVVRGGAP